MWPFQSSRRKAGPVPGDGRPRVLLLWWGAFEKGGGTLGDYHSVRNLADALAARGVASDIMSGAGLDFGPHRVIGHDAGNPHLYRAVAFVCGPFIVRGRTKRLLKPFSKIPTAALAVSVIGPRQQTERFFDAIVERDSTDAVRFDLALAGPEPEPGTIARDRLSVCLRGRQSDYGRDANLSDLADAAILAAAVVPGEDAQRIDTVMSGTNPIRHIEEQFARSRLLLTTRLHGALFALLYRVPFIAIDQVRGGAKVTRLMARIGWPHLLDAATLDPASLAAVARAVDAAGWTEAMELARARAVGMSNAMMAECVDCLVSLGGIARSG